MMAKNTPMKTTGRSDTPALRIINATAVNTRAATSITVLTMTSPR